jgi:hypothetical protein
MSTYRQQLLAIAALCIGTSITVALLGYMW